MKNQSMRTIHACTAALCVALLFAAGALAATGPTLAEGTVIGLRMEDELSSATARVGDTFQATVANSISINDAIAVPAGSRVEGRVTEVKQAESGIRPAAIGLQFYRLTLPDDTSYDIEGVLSAQTGSPVPIGGGGLKAILGAVLGGGSRQSSVLSGGTEVNVPVGSEISMQLVQPVSLGLYGTAQTSKGLEVYTSREMVRNAQTALRERNYYSGPVDGVMDEDVRRAIRKFQHDNELSATGELNRPTAALLGLVPAGERGGWDLRLADSIQRKARSLLENYEESLGIRVGDIRSALTTTSRNLTEWDLDLLLQLDGFANAANWYRQIVREAPDAERARVAARVLARCAKRVEESMAQAREDRRFQTAWADIQTDLQELDREHNRPRAGSWLGRGRLSQPGYFHWQGIVDGMDNILIRGSSVQIQHLRAQPIENSSYDLPEPLPQRAVAVTLKKIQGRGNIRLLEQPAASNNYTAVVQVDDQNKGGKAFYEFTLEW